MTSFTFSDFLHLDTQEKTSTAAAAHVTFSGKGHSQKNKDGNMDYNRADKLYRMAK